MANVFTYSIKHRIKAIYFENISLNRLREFRSLLKSFAALPETIASLVSKKHLFKSERLKHLLTPDTEGGLYPSELLPALKAFDNMIVWKKTGGGGADDEIPEP